MFANYSPTLCIYSYFFRFFPAHILFFANFHTPIEDAKIFAVAPYVFCAWNITRVYKENKNPRSFLLLLFTGQRLLYLFLCPRRLFQLACLYLYVIEINYLNFE